jgi:hypothetical protein
MTGPFRYPYFKAQSSFTPLPDNDLSKVAFELTTLVEFITIGDNGKRFFAGFLLNKKVFVLFYFSLSLSGFLNFFCFLCCTMNSDLAVTLSLASEGGSPIELERGVLGTPEEIDAIRIPKISAALGGARAPPKKVDEVKDTDMGGIVDSAPVVQSGSLGHLMTKLIRRDETRGAFSTLKSCDPTQWADLDEFFILFEHSCCVSELRGHDMVAQLKAKLSPQIFERLDQLKGYPNFEYNELRNGILDIWGIRNPLSEYERQLGSLQATSAAALQAPFRSLMRRFERALARVGEPDERHLPNRVQVECWLKGLPTELRSGIETGLAWHQPVGSRVSYPPIDCVIQRTVDEEERRNAKHSPATILVGAAPHNQRFKPKQQAANIGGKGVKKPFPKKPIVKPAAQQGSGGVRCFGCGGRGHIRAQCPSSSPQTPKPVQAINTAQPSKLRPDTDIVRIRCVIGNISTPVIIDTASSYSLIHVNFLPSLRKIDIVQDSPVPPREITTVVGVFGCLSRKLEVLYSLGQHQLMMSVFVVDNLPACALFGVDMLYPLKTIINLKTLQCVFHIGTNNTRYCTPIERVRNNLLSVEYCVFNPLESKLVRVQRPDQTVFVSETGTTTINKGFLVARGVLPHNALDCCVLLINTQQKQCRILPGDVLACVTTDVAEKEESTLVEPNVMTIESLLSGLWKDVQARISRMEYKKFVTLVTKYVHLFQENTRGNTTSRVKHVIDTGDHTPVNTPPYQTTPQRRQIIDEHITKMLSDNIIRPSKSPWASGVVLVPKKSGGVRFCVDYRRLNAITKRDVYPLPRVDDVLSSLQGKKWFSKLDLTSGYWQILVDDASREKTAFISSSGLYEFNVMPFGLTNAPATFQRLMDLVLAGVKWQYGLVYLDDIIVYSATFDNHIKDLKEVFDRFTESQLVVNPAKCSFCEKSVEYLGHVISSEGISPDPQKVEAIQGIAAPGNIKQLQSFLGLANYYRRFVKNFATSAAPLYRLLHKNVPWKWGLAEDKAFRMVKASIASKSLLFHPDWSLPFVLDTDGSKIGLGAVLSQIRDGCEEPLAFASRSLSPAEAKWHCCEFEALAVVWGVQTFAHFLSDKPFTVRVDHHNLRWLQTATKSRLQRWALELQGYHYTVEYRRGIEHCNCDGLSRNPTAGEIKDPASRTTCCLCSHTNYPLADDNCLLTVANDSTCDFNLIELRRAQQSDSFYQEIVTKLRTPHSVDTVGETERKQDFCVENDLLFFIDKSSSWLPVLRLYAPAAFRDKICQLFHSSELSGHLGVTKTYGRLRERFYWPRMSHDIRRFVQSCELCQKRKTRARRHGLLRPIDVNEPWEVVGMDLLGELPRTQKGNRYCLVFIDHFTKWPEVIPLRQIDANTISDCIHKYLICRHGCPAKLLSDRGPQFLASIVRRLCHRYGISKVFTTAYHPQGDPQAERFMKILADTMAVLSNERRKDWDKFCDSIAFAYRTAVHPTTRYTPFFLNHLREAKFPQDRVFEEELGAIPSLLSPDLDEARFAVMKKVRAQVHEFIRESQLKSKRLYDRKATELQFNVGSLVMVQRPPGIARKLEDKWIGPFTVIAVDDNGLTYTVKPKSGSEQRVHINRLAPFYNAIDPIVTDATSTSLRENDLSEPIAHVDTVDITGSAKSISVDEDVDMNGFNNDIDASDLEDFVINIDDIDE